jgi:hypothetical protein
MHVGGRTKGDIDAGGVLPAFSGVLVRDGYSGYEHLTRLPLAVRIAATRLAGRRQARVADIVEDITHDQDRLAALSSGEDEHSAVRTVFDWSYTSLRPELARVFRRLGVHPGAEVGG